MPRRPGGGEAPPDSIEAGLRALVLGAGPDIRKLSKGQMEGLSRIMQAAQTPGTWPVDAKAAAVLAVIYEIADQLPRPGWKAAAQAALRIPAEQFTSSECESLAGRFKALARSERAQDSDVSGRAAAHRGYWTLAASHMARSLEARLNEINGLEGLWHRYREGEPQLPPRSMPLTFERTDVLYRFEGYRGIECISYRWLIAHSEVDHFEPMGWYYNQPDAPVIVTPLANCSLQGPYRELPQGGRGADLIFSHALAPDERYFFAYSTLFNSDQPCRPTILYEVRGQGIQHLVVRVQFDPDAMPTKCWYFDVDEQSEGWQIPVADAPELLRISRNGYVEYEFVGCIRGHKYGLRWIWPQEAASSAGAEGKER